MAEADIAALARRLEELERRHDALRARCLVARTTAQFALLAIDARGDEPHLCKNLVETLRTAVDHEDHIKVYNEAGRKAALEEIAVLEDLIHRRALRRSPEID